MERHFTATVYILNEDKVLLINHRKLQKWLPPGGHVDPNETPAEAAAREAVEETGIEIEFIRQENIWINESNARSFERPYLCLMEEIPPFGSKGAHQHMDFVYVARPKGGVERENLIETAGLKWFTLEEVEQLAEEVDLFRETKQVIRNLFKEYGAVTTPLS